LSAFVKGIFAMYIAKTKPVLGEIVANNKKINCSSTMNLQLMFRFLISESAELKEVEKISQLLFFEEK
jgi:hypothetical protein